MFGSKQAIGELGLPRAAKLELLLYLQSTLFSMTDFLSYGNRRFFEVRQHEGGSLFLIFLEQQNIKQSITEQSCIMEYRTVFGGLIPQETQKHCTLRQILK